MRLKDALLKDSSKAFRATTDDENWEDFSKFDLEPLSGAILAKDCALGPFEGAFVVGGKVVTKLNASVSPYQRSSPRVARPKLAMLLTFMSTSRFWETFIDKFRMCRTEAKCNFA